MTNPPIRLGPFLFRVEPRELPREAFAQGEGFSTLRQHRVRHFAPHVILPSRRQYSDHRADAPKVAQLPCTSRVTMTVATNSASPGLPTNSASVLPAYSPVSAARVRMKSMDVIGVYLPARFVKISSLSSGCTPCRAQS
jgi:hypothetical protein